MGGLGSRRGWVMLGVCLNLGMGLGRFGREGLEGGTGCLGPLAPTGS